MKSVQSDHTKENKPGTSRSLKVQKSKSIFNSERTPLSKFQCQKISVQFCRAKNTRRDMQKARKLFSPTVNSKKPFLRSRKHQKTKTEKKSNFFYSAENPKESSMLAKLLVSCKN